MKVPETTVGCQVPGVPEMSEGFATLPPQSLSRRLKLMIRRHMSPKTERKFKKRTNDLMNWFSRLRGVQELPIAPPAVDSIVHLQAGDWVRVRPREEIDATLNHWRQLRGCTFMPEMDEYCGTTQQVLKRMERFVDERDLTVKKANGIVLLDRVFCKGTTEFGRCDRSCVLFWREEWLEKIEQPEY